ncbi:hypothetical protein EUX98_g3970 [Antrodiella citrinella]|uniref:K Homology domain-containing protein n=1 Tax=Antrodiella citrinella TaxID=2447956 RepID=A0A4S4MXZ6_9APHY|nr:hypothetical protein EUX98_g3970 [Antrodiella citrinella]
MSSKRKWDQAGPPTDGEPPAKAAKPDEGKTAAEAAAAAAAIAAKIAAQFAGATGSGTLGPKDPHDGDFVHDIDINDVRNRYLLTKGSTQSQIHEDTGASVSTKGTWYPDRTKATEKDPPLYLHLSATSQEMLQNATDKVNELISMDMGSLVEDKKDRMREKRKWPEEKIPVGIDSIRNFNVRAKVVGPSGMFVKYIQQETGTRVQIKGIGSGFVDQETGQEHDEPMFIHVTGPDEGQVTRAKVLTEDLLEVVREEHAKVKVQLQHQQMELHQAQMQYAAYSAYAGYVPPQPGAAPPPAAPPLPRRQSTSTTPSPVSSTPPAPPARRFTRQPNEISPDPPLPSSISRNDSTATDQPKIDWSNLSLEDKTAFFSLLDEYFESRRGQGQLKASGVGQISSSREPVAASSAPPPPPVATWARPKLTSPNVSSTGEFALSYPPPTQYGSGAQDLAQFFSSQTHWDSAWYKSEKALPPPLENAAVPGYMSAWETQGAKKVIHGGVIFADLSFCWYTVTFSAHASADPNDARAVQRSAFYLPTPKPMDRAALVEAHETYGETVAGFAESYEGTGEYCLRGECWDLASEALKYFEQFDYVPAPVPSTACTHGHLIFSGKASSSSRQPPVGKWRGGDDRVRRGDIVQWRSAKVEFASGGHASLGDPDHTAIVVAESVPSEAVGDGMSVKPGVIGVLEVVEQSVGSPPKREKYDLSRMTEGEIWIYRPVGMEAYLGTVLAAKVPEGVNVVSV